MKKIAWIGTGVMGYAMVSHLIDAGYPVSVFTRTVAKAESLRDKAQVCMTIEEAVKDADIIFTIVGYPQDVEEVYGSEKGVFKFAKKGALCVDMTTSSPTLAEKLAKDAKDCGLRMMDAPVSGGDIGARNATLTIMVGGEEADFEEVLDCFKLMGKQFTLIGPAGSGQHCKMANQIVIAGNISAVAESLTYVKKTGLDPQKVLSAISAGSAASWQLANNGPKMLSGNFDPGFYIHHYIKDLKLAKEEAASVGLKLPVLEQVLGLYEELAQDGYSLLGTQALIKAYDPEK